MNIQQRETLKDCWSSFMPKVLLSGVVGCVCVSVHSDNFPITCDRFDLQWSFNAERKILTLSIDTDLPDSALVNVRVTRQFDYQKLRFYPTFERLMLSDRVNYVPEQSSLRFSSIKEWRKPRQITIDEPMWMMLEEDLEEEHVEVRIKKIYDTVEIRAEVYGVLGTASKFKARDRNSPLFIGKTITRHGKANDPSDVVIARNVFENPSRGLFPVPEASDPMIIGGMRYAMGADVFDFQKKAKTYLSPVPWHGEEWKEWKPFTILYVRRRPIEQDFSVKIMWRDSEKSEVDVFVRFESGWIGVPMRYFKHKIDYLAYAFCYPATVSDETYAEFVDHDIESKHISGNGLEKMLVRRDHRFRYKCRIDPTYEPGVDY